MCARVRARPSRAASIAEVFDDAHAPTGGARMASCQRCCRGMVGSTIGWLEVPYLPCPAELVRARGQSRAGSRRGVHRLRHALQQPARRARRHARRGDAAARRAASRRIARSTAAQLVCMPGTHTKWVSLHKGVVQEFLTAPTGELFAMLCEHSVLVRDKATPIVHQPADFERGLAESAHHPEVPLLHRLFQSRSLRLDKQLTRGRRRIVDVGAAHRHGRRRRAVAVRRTCRARHRCTSSARRSSPSPMRCALARHGRKAVCIEGDKAALAGLTLRVSRAGAPEDHEHDHDTELVAILRGLTPERAPEVGAALVGAASAPSKCR